MPRTFIHRVAPVIGSALLVALAGCSTPTDDILILPIADVERARERKLMVVPPVHRVTREEYAADSEKSAKEREADSLSELRDSYGRLGFFPVTFDPASTARATSAFYGAFYSQIDKDITVIDDASPSLLVHELTHAIQDQYFDLTRLVKTSTSTDEALAVRGLIEGDAVLAQERYLIWESGNDPTSAVANYYAAGEGRAESEKTLDEATVQPFFFALPSFAYSIGAAYVASLLQVQQGAWSYAQVDDRLKASGPKSTQEVIRGGVDVDAIVPTGLETLPAVAAADYEVGSVDRVGEYYTYLLFRPDGSSRPSLQQLTSAWDGDQLVVLHRKDKGPSGLVWTSVWDSEYEASEIARRLVELHAGSTTPLSETHAYMARDGEAFWVEQRDDQVCFVKNMAPAVMERIAHVALSTKDEKRMDIVNVVATLPPMHRATCSREALTAPRVQRRAPTRSRAARGPTPPL